MNGNEPAGIDDPELLCETIAELIDVLETSDHLTEDRASELRSNVYQSIDLGELPEEEGEL